jgi:hypothetical protein
VCSPGCGGGGGVVAVATVVTASKSRDGDESDIFFSNQVRGRKLIKSVWRQFFDYGCAGGQPRDIGMIDLFAARGALIPSQR